VVFTAILKFASHMQVIRASWERSTQCSRKNRNRRGGARKGEGGFKMIGGATQRLEGRRAGRASGVGLGFHCNQSMKRRKNPVKNSNASFQE